MTCAPMREPRRLVRISGVQPSPSVTMEASEGGNTGAYRHMLPGPLETSRQSDLVRMASRSKRTSRGQPQWHRLAARPASSLFARRLHSKYVALGIKLKV